MPRIRGLPGLAGLRDANKAEAGGLSNGEAARD